MGGIRRIRAASWIRGWILGCGLDPARPASTPTVVYLTRPTLSALRLPAFLGSGKSSFAKKFLEAKGYVRVNRVPAALRHAWRRGAGATNACAVGARRIGRAEHGGAVHRCGAGGAGVEKVCGARQYQP